MDAEEARRRLAGARVARLATVRPDGRPHLVPVVFAVDGDTIVTAVDDKPKSTTNLQRLHNVRAHPEVTLLADHYEQDWSRLWWVRADGRARVVESGAPREAAAARLADRYQQYDAPPAGPAILVEVHTWTAWDP